MVCSDYLLVEYLKNLVRIYDSITHVVNTRLSNVHNTYLCFIADFFSCLCVLKTNRDSFKYLSVPWSTSVLYHDVLLLCWFFFPILRGRAVLRFSHYKVFVFAVRALGFMKSALRITLHSPLS